jgi:hypothetical protein
MKKLFIIFAVLCLAAPAMAADWNFYGSARMATWRTINDLGNPVDSDDDTAWGQQGNSRLGATVKVNDQIGGAFEYGTGVNLRKLYGTYNFGGGELLFGQTYTPSSSLFYSNSVYAADGDLLGVGQFYVGRVPMVQLKMGGLKVALIKPASGGTTVKGDNDDAVYRWYTTGGGDIDFQGTAEEATEFQEAALAAGAITKEEAASRFVLVGPTGAFEVKDTDVDYPKLEVAYQFKTDMFFVDAFAGYQTYTLSSASKDYDIDSYVAGIGGGVTFGPAYFNAGVHMGQNLGNYGALGFVPPDNISAAQTTALADQHIGFATYAKATDEIKDNDGLGYLAVIGFNASEMFTIEAGYGKQEYEPDVSNAKKDTAEQYYVNCTINIAPGFFIVPEIGKVKYEIQDADAGDFMYYGAKWQINF